MQQNPGGGWLDQVLTDGDSIDNGLTYVEHGQCSSHTQQQK